VPPLRRISPAPAPVSAAPVSSDPGGAPLRGLSRHGSTVALAVVVAAAVVIGVVLTHYALLLWTHTFDEDIYKGAGIYTADHFPGALWETHLSTRGIQRLESWVFAAGFTLADGPAAFRLIRVINIVFFCSTVIPVWLWARSLGTRGVPAAAAALLTILVPWATVTAMFFTENVAYPAVTWALYAIWAAAVRPRPRVLVLALAAVVVAALARSVMVVLAVFLVVSVVAVAVRCHGRAAWAARSTWTPRQIAPWALLGLAFLVALAFYAFDRSAFSEQLTGSYTADVLFRLGDLGDATRISLARVISGIGILPGIVAIAWVGRTLWRPADPQRFALAVIAVLTAVFVIYSAMRGGPDERYLMYLAPVLLLCAAQAVDRRDVGPVGVMVAAALVVWLFASVPWSADQHAYGFLVSAAQAFHARILLLSLGSHLPGVGLSYAAILAVGILAVSALAAWALWRGGRAGLGLGVVLALGLLAVQAAQLGYVERHFQRETMWGPDLQGRAWADQAIPAGAQAGVFMTNQSAAPTPLTESWREIAFWNLKLDHLLIAPGAPDLVPLNMGPKLGVTIDPASGRLVSEGGVPRYLVEPRVRPIAPLAGPTIAEAGYEPFALVDAGATPRVQWEVLGVDDLAWSIPGQATAIRVFRGTPGAAGDCLDLGLTTPDELSGTRRVVVRSGTFTRRLTLKASQTATVRAIPLRPAGPGAFSDVAVDAAGVTKLADGRRTAVNVGSVARVACR
jgi:hypothetical protein